MKEYNLLLPSMGEGVHEATIIKWLKKEGDKVEKDEIIVELATDKVDSDLPSPVSGIIKEIIIDSNKVVKIGQTIAIILIHPENKYNSDITQNFISKENLLSNKQYDNRKFFENNDILKCNTDIYTSVEIKNLSPLVKSIINKENISKEDLVKINGTGRNNRITKNDLIKYIQKRNEEINYIKHNIDLTKDDKLSYDRQYNNLNDDVIYMDRVRNIISNNMRKSINTSVHVTSFVEADATNIVIWRKNNKNFFREKYGYNITYLPFFIYAVVKAIKDFPMINISVKDNNIIIKKHDINIGIAIALDDGNLIVPVIKNADRYNVIGISQILHNIIIKSKTNSLTIDDISNGTYTISNIGSFDNILGTPIINQPQVAILAIGKILKKPAVIETEHGDLIGIRHKLYLSHTYDHRVIDGSLGGRFVSRVAEYISKFDLTFKI